MDNYGYGTQQYLQTEYQPASEMRAMPNHTMQDTFILPLSGGSTNNGNYYLNPNSSAMMSNQSMANQNSDMRTISTYQEPETVTNPDYIPAFLKSNIGRWARIDFLIGNGIEQRVGQILEVGASYLVLRALEPETVVMCDLFSIKFATIIMDGNVSRLFTL